MTRGISGLIGPSESVDIWRREILAHAGKITKFLCSGLKGITGFSVEVWYFL
jgi:hypothetical protein